MLIYKCSSVVLRAQSDAAAALLKINKELSRLTKNSPKTLTAKRQLIG